MGGDWLGGKGGLNRFHAGNRIALSGFVWLTRWGGWVGGFALAAGFLNGGEMKCFLNPVHEKYGVILEK